MSVLDRLAQLSDGKRALLGRMLRQEQPRAPIAVVGMACRFPGGASDPESFWRLLRDGRDVISEVPRDRWDLDRVYDPDPDAPGKVYTRWGGFLEGIDQFDAPMFGISQAEAEAMDPQQRVLLEVAWEALEAAGYPPNGLAGSRTGVFMGLFQSAYAELRAQHGDRAAVDAYSVNGIAHCMAVGRLSFLFGFQGPSVPVNTACSSSLVALHLACQSLRSGESELALAGGVNLMLSLDWLISLCRMRAISPDGRCKAFDAAANGMVESEGCGVLVLKRLSDAQAAGDRILAVIRGSAVNHDGRSASLTAPNGLAQQAVIREALASAGVAPSDVTHLEAHGTGTPLGDPIEIEAAGAVLGEDRKPGDRVWLTSVKTNIGHAEAAAGIASLIKVILAFQHEALPPHLHFRALNPHVSPDRFPFSIPTELTHWPRSDRPRISGVSSFGMSGTNAHVILQEAPPRSPRPAGAARARHLFCLSSQTEVGLRQLAERYRAHVAQPGSLPEVASLGDLAFTANAGRSHFQERLAVTAGSPAELDTRLKLFLEGGVKSGIARARARVDGRPRIAFLFSGQGSQTPGMGLRLYQGEPVFRRTLDACAAALRDILELPLLDVMFGRGTPEGLCDQTAYTQPLIYSLQCALCDLWRSWGVVPDAVLGHSLGEIGAAYAAGVLSLEDGARLVGERGRLMQSMPRGEMASVPAPADVVEATIRDLASHVSVAAINADAVTVISGHGPPMAEALQRLEQAGHSPRRLQVSHAYHSPSMEPILEAFEQVAARVRYARPSLPLISNLTGKEVDGLDAGYLRRHLREPVRFSDGLKALLASEVHALVEIGPHTTLTALAASAIPAGQVTVVPSLRRGEDDWEVLLSAAGALYTLGAELDFRAMDRPFLHRSIPAPTYSFQRRRYWLKSRPLDERAQRTTAHPLLQQAIRTPEGHAYLEGEISGEEERPFLEHRVRGTPLLPAVATLGAMLAAAEKVAGGGPWALHQVRLHAPVVLGTGVRVQIFLGAEDNGKRRVDLHARDAKAAESAGWTHIASAELRRAEDRQAAPGTGNEPRPDAAEGGRAVDGRACYELLARGGLEYGESFRLIDRLRVNGPTAAADLRAPSWGEPWGMSPASADACLQVLAVLQRMLLEQGPGAADTYVPVAAEQVWMDHRRAPVSCQVSLRGEPGGEEARGDVLATDAAGVPVLEVRGLVVRHTVRTGLEPGLQHLYGLEWRTVPGGGAAVGPEAWRGTWVVLADEGGVAESVAGRLRTRGARCVLVARGQGGQPRRRGERKFHPDLLELGTAGPDAPREVLQALIKAGNPARGLINLWPLDERPEPESAHRMVLDLISVVRSATGIEGAAPPRLFIVTRGAQAAGGDMGGEGLFQAALWGAAGVVALEHPEIWGGCVDLGPTDQGEQAAAAVEAALVSGREDLIAARRGGSLVPRITRLNVRAGTPTLPEDKTYLVTGGLGALGLRVAHWLVARGARQLVLLGRSPPSARVSARLEGLRAAGAVVRAVQADVSRELELREALSLAIDPACPLRGVVHAAGVLADGALASHTREQVEAVMAPKVQGAWNLHKLTAGQDLDFFVLFSSASAVLGLHGQVAYAAANAALDALAHFRRSRGLPALSINWGPWAQEGLAALSGRRWVDWGINDLNPGATLDAMGALLLDGPAQALALHADWGVLAERFGRGQAPLFSELAPATEEPRESGGVSGLIDRLRRLLPRERSNAFQHELRTLMATLLNLPDLEVVAATRPLVEVGVDSLRAVELRNALGRFFARAFPSTLLFDYPTVEALTRYLSAEDPGLRELLSVTDAATGAADERPVPPATLLDRLAELSEQEAEILAASLEASLER
jgi:acyl transferase domain-containing protein